MPPSSADLRLALHVQHHPARAHLLESLLSALGECTVISDPEPDGKPSAIRTYLACLRAVPDDASHVLIVQDDVRPCRGFRAKAEAAIAEKPDDMIAFYVGGAPHRSAQTVRRAFRAGERWAQLHPKDWVPTVCTCWPRERVEAFVVFVDKNPSLIRVGDDNVLGEFVRRENVPVWAIVPSIAQHEDRVASLIGRRASAGQNKMRVAAVFADDPL